MKYYGILHLDLELHLRNGTYFIIYFHSSLLSAPSIDITFGKLEAIKSVTSAYQEIAGLNISGRKLEKI